MDIDAGAPRPRIGRLQAAANQDRRRNLVDRRVDLVAVGQLLRQRLAEIAVCDEGVIDGAKAVKGEVAKAAANGVANQQRPRQNSGSDSDAESDGDMDAPVVGKRPPQQQAWGHQGHQVPGGFGTLGHSGIRRLVPQLENPCQAWQKVRKAETEAQAEAWAQLRQAQQSLDALQEHPNPQDSVLHWSGLGIHSRNVGTMISSNSPAVEPQRADSGLSLAPRETESGIVFRRARQAPPAPITDVSISRRPRRSGGFGRSRCD